MAFSLINHVVKQSTDTNGGTSSAIDTTGANLLILALADYALVTAGTVSDSKSNSWTGLTVQINAVQRIRLFYVINPIVGSGHTFTVTSTGGFPVWAVQAWSGAATTAPFDVQNGAANDTPGTTIATGSITPTQNDSLVVATMNSESPTTTSITVDSGMTDSDMVASVAATAFGIEFSYKIQTASAAINPTFTTNATENNHAAVIASFTSNSSNWFNFF